MATAIVSFVVFAAPVAAQQPLLPPDDKQQIIENLEMLDESVNKRDMSEVLSLISPNHLVLREEVRDTLEETFKREIIDYRIHFIHNGIYDRDLSQSITVLNPTKVRVEASSLTNGEGEPIYFVFEREDKASGARWFIAETDFHKKMGSGLAQSAVKDVVFKGFGLLFILSLIFVFVILPALIIAIIFYWRKGSRKGA